MQLFNQHMNLEAAPNKNQYALFVPKEKKHGIFFKKYVFIRTNSSFFQELKELIEI